MRLSRRALRTLAIGAVAAVLLPLVAAQPASAAPPIVVGDPARPSAIAVTGGSTYLFSAGSAGLMDVACVVFVNHGPRTATKVGLNLAYVAASGTVLGVDFIYPSGKFFVDARSAFSGVRGATPVSNGNCHPMFATRNALHTTFQYRMGRGAPPTDVAAILVSAREIVYDDGTAWRTDQVPQPGDQVAPPPALPFTAAVGDGPPVLTARAVSGAPVELNDAIGFGIYSRGQSACVTFTDRDTRVAKRVNVALALVDRTGTVVDVKTSYNTGTFSPGILIDNSFGGCIEFAGTVDGDSFLARPAGGGAAIPIGRIIASLLLVEFADGTSWQAPNPPQAGDRITAP